MPSCNYTNNNKPLKNIYIITMVFESNEEGGKQKTLIFSTDGKSTSDKPAWGETTQ
jgi:hypothetical protein